MVSISQTCLTHSDAGGVANLSAVRFSAEAIMALDSKHKINDRYYVRDVDEMIMKFDHQYLAEDIVTQRRLRSEMKARYSVRPAPIHGVGECTLTITCTT